MTRKKKNNFSKKLLQPFPVFASAFFESEFEWAKNLDLEVLNDALSFEIEKYRGQNFREYRPIGQCSIFSWTVS